MPLFLSTPSARRATSPACTRAVVYANFYPRPPRGGRHSDPEGQHVHYAISIHALREEGDRSSSCTTHRPSDFYPRPPRGGRRYGYGKHKVWVIFLSTPSARRATAVSPSNTYKLTFLSTPSARRATTILARSMQRGEFLSTPSARRATVRSVLSQSSRMDFYPRPPRGGRLPEIINEEEQLDISIHALREEGDESPRNERHLTGDFYPRPPRGGRPYRWQGSHLYYHDFYPRPPRGGRPKKRSSALLFCRFLSTPSARRATSRWSPPGKAPAAFLSTPSARRATIRSRNGGVDRGISIHALREEGDRHCHVSQWREKNFYPRPPRGGRRLTSMVSGYVEPLISIHALREEGDRANSCTCLWQAGISIHALREEGDCPQRASPPQPFYFYPRPPRGGRRCSDMRTSGPAAYFYPRPPRGGRPLWPVLPGVLLYFYPRPPRGGRHNGHLDLVRLPDISIHALREEGDGRELGRVPNLNLFLSTPSARRATYGCPQPGCGRVISIHALREEGDHKYAPRPRYSGDFYPRPPRGGRLAVIWSPS